MPENNYIAAFMRDNNIELGDSFMVSTQNGNFDGQADNIYHLRKTPENCYELINTNYANGPFVYVLIRILSGELKIKKVQI